MTVQFEPLVGAQGSVPAYGATELESVKAAGARDGWLQPKPLQQSLRW